MSLLQGWLSAQLGLDSLHPAFVRLRRDRGDVRGPAVPGLRRHGHLRATRAAAPVQAHPVSQATAPVPSHSPQQGQQHVAQAQAHGTAQAQPPPQPNHGRLSRGRLQPLSRGQPLPLPFAPPSPPRSLPLLPLHSPRRPSSPSLSDRPPRRADLLRLHQLLSVHLLPSPSPSSSLLLHSPSPPLLLPPKRRFRRLPVRPHRAHPPEPPTVSRLPEGDDGVDVEAGGGWTEGRVFERGGGVERGGVLDEDEEDEDPINSSLAAVEGGRRRQPTPPPRRSAWQCVSGPSTAKRRGGGRWTSPQSAAGRALCSSTSPR